MEQSFYTAPGHLVFILPSNCFQSSPLSSKLSFPAFLLPVSNDCIFYITEETEAIKPFISPHPSQSSNSYLSFKVQIRHYPSPLYMWPHTISQNLQCMFEHLTPDFMISFFTWYQLLFCICFFLLDQNVLHGTLQCDYMTIELLSPNR